MAARTTKAKPKRTIAKKGTSRASTARTATKRSSTMAKKRTGTRSRSS